MTDDMNMVLLMKCPLCDGVFIGSGDFSNNEGRIIRAGTTPQEDCIKCLQVAIVCGLEHDLGAVDVYDLRRGD